MKCPHCGKKINHDGDSGFFAALLLVGLFIVFATAYAQGWLP